MTDQHWRNIVALQARNAAKAAEAHNPWGSGHVPAGFRAVTLGAAPGRMGSVHLIPDNIAPITSRTTAAR